MRSAPVFSSKLALCVGLTVFIAVGAPAACFYPSYTFDGPEPTGSGGAPGSSQSSQNTVSSSSSASSSSSTASSSSAASSTSATSSSSGMDVCSGMVDCSNPKCSAYACVTSVPAGWTGYYALYDGPAAADPGCAPLFTVDAYTGNGGLTSVPATCSTCTCGAPTGQTCTLGNVGATGSPVFVSNLTCAQQQQPGTTSCGFSLGAVADGSCYNQGSLPGNNKTCANFSNNTCPAGALACDVGTQVGTVTATGGACAPSPEIPNIPKFQWGSLGHACAQMMPGTGCNVGQACLPKVGSPYEKGICISKVGENACPPAFPTQHVYYEDKTDTRACSACVCGPVTGASCSTTLNVYSDAGCNTLLASIPAGACADLGGNPAVAGRKAVNTTFTGGTCAADPAGGVSIGAVAGVNPTTFCCK